MAKGDRAPKPAAAKPKPARAKKPTGAQTKSPFTPANPYGSTQFPASWIRDYNSMNKSTL